jgi:hypothetical protein
MHILKEPSAQNKEKGVEQAKEWHAERKIPSC